MNNNQKKPKSQLARGVNWPLRATCSTPLLPACYWRVHCNSLQRQASIRVRLRRHRQMPTNPGQIDFFLLSLSLSLSSSSIPQLCAVYQASFKLNLIPQSVSFLRLRSILCPLNANCAPFLTITYTSSRPHAHFNIIFILLLLPYPRSFLLSGNPETPISSHQNPRRHRPHRGPPSIL